AGSEGYGKGFLTEIEGKKGRLYSPVAHLTPPFPGYPSGHSTVSGAASRMLELFTGSDHLGVVCKHEAGSLTGERGIAPGIILATDGKQPRDAPNTKEASLECPTFSSPAQMAGISRVMGGYHIQSDNVAGLDLGKKVAEHTWPMYRAHFDGEPAAPAG